MGVWANDAVGAPDERASKEPGSGWANDTADAAAGVAVDTEADVGSEGDAVPAAGVDDAAVDEVAGIIGAGGANAGEAAWNGVE